MKTRQRIILTATSVWLAVSVNAQGYACYDHIPTSTLMDNQGHTFGSGSMHIVSAGVNIPLSVKQDGRGRAKAWTSAIRLAYGQLDNRGEAAKMNPDDMLNGSINIQHVRPVSGRWSVGLSAGCGIYAPLNGISGKAVLANGGAVFMYRAGRNLTLGAGMGLTNSYGIPMVMPVLYLSWTTDGAFDFKIDMSTGLKVTAAKSIGKHVRMELVAMDVDGMSAVTDIEGQGHIYSTVILKSYFRPTVKLGFGTSIYLDIGGNWLRGIAVSERSLRGFLDNFKEDGDENKRFNVTLRLAAGIRYDI